jgi:hypothetical protein
MDTLNTLGGAGLGGTVTCSSVVASGLKAPVWRKLLGEFWAASAREAELLPRVKGAQTFVSNINLAEPIGGQRDSEFPCAELRL